MRLQLATGSGELGKATGIITERVDVWRAHRSNVNMGFVEVSNEYPPPLEARGSVGMPAG